MEQNWKILQSATESLRHFVKGFDLFRNDNLLLSDLLEKIESLLETPKYKSKSEFTTENEHTYCIDTDMEKPSSRQNQSHSDQKSQVQHFAGKKRKRGLPTQKDSPTIENVNLGIAAEEFEATPEKSPEDQVFAIDLLLRSILTTLPPSDLKTCRLVNPIWNSTATQILLGKRAFKIEFNFRECFEDCYEQDPRIPRRNNSHDLTLLSKIIDNRIQSLSQALQFPCNSFAFHASNLNSEYLQSFLKKFGHIIKNLEISLYYDDDDDEPYDNYKHFDPEAYNEYKILHDFRQLLRNDLPNLENLVVGGFPLLWFQDEDWSELFPEPRLDKKLILNLKSVRFSSAPPQKILDDILDSCPSLRDVGLHDHDGGEKLVLKSFIEMNRAHLLTEFRMTLSRANLDYYENSLCGNLKDVRLKKLVLRSEQINDSGYWMRVSQVLTSFLRSSSESLTELHTESLGDCLGIEIPIMRNLKTIHLLPRNITRPDNSKLFPNGFRLSQVFPRLESFECSVIYNLYDYSDLDWDYDVRALSDDLLESVKRLSFEHGPPVAWVEKFCTLFPNLVTVELGIVEDFQRAAKTLWKLERLESLSVGLNLNEDDEDDDDERNSFEVDSGFTGFPVETCSLLHETSRDIDVSQLEQKRKGPSILDVKNLKKLNLSIYETSEDDRSFGIVPVMSHVTGLFAFKLCPQLRVNLSVCSRKRGKNMRSLLCGLSPIMPYVHTFQQVMIPWSLID